MKRRKIDRNDIPNESNRHDYESEMPPCPRWGASKRRNAGACGAQVARGRALENRSRGSRFDSDPPPSVSFDRLAASAHANGMVFHFDKIRTGARLHYCGRYCDLNRKQMRALAATLTKWAGRAS